MASCAEFQGSLAAAVYADLGAAEQARLEAHLALCPACLREFEAFRELVSRMGSGPLGITPAEEERAIKALGAKGFTRRKLLRRAPSRWPALISLAAAALILIGYAVQVRPPAPLGTPPSAAPLAAAPPKALPLPPEPPPTPEPLPAPLPPPLPKPPPVPPAPPTPEPVTPAATPLPEPKTTPKATVAVIARLENVQGRVLIDGAPAAEGADVIPGLRIATVGRSSVAVVRYPDGTRLELGPDSVLREDSADAKRGVLERGTLRAVVAKQPAGRPLLLKTPSVEATVLGTVLLLDADRHHLEVHEGRVRFSRSADGASVEVGAGRAVDAGSLQPRLIPATLGLVALYTFEEGRGNRILDRSGHGVPLDLALRNPGAAEWRAGGLHLRPYPRLMTEGPALKITEACRASNEITLEAWILPDKASLGFDGVIAALSRDNADRNVALVQAHNGPRGSQFDASLRLSGTDAAGRPPLETPLGIVKAQLTQLVLVRSAAGVERLYVDGVLRSTRTRTGTFATWSPDFRLTLGDEITEERPWEGVLRRVAVYSRALGPVEITRNLSCGGAP